MNSIVTVTLNPAIDHTVFVDKLAAGTVHRASRSHRQAGGKGLNVATMLSLGGHDATVSGFLGEDNPSIFIKHFRDHQLEDAFVRVAGETRTGIKIVDTSADETTDINLPGPAPTEAQCDKLLMRLDFLAEAGRWFLLAGSLPSGVNPDFLVRIIRTLKAKDALVAVDTSGPALAAAVDAGVDLAKPNNHELEELIGAKLESFEDVLLAARALRREKVSRLVVSLGDEGALFLTPEAELKASAPPVNVVSTVGAGDSLLAGFLQATVRGDSPSDCARLATVYAWSRLESLVSALPEPDVLKQRMGQVSVQSLVSLNS
ncbi:1-phosphofructokinase [Coraliomargarita parva]|uniref:1-phosphofructokinase n=1 Tax=Coraliomargarita parva TaxID=3014050 RepID=UPI0022B30C6F|nr:1-phosphofructokinase [Coraliomargarita parva]